METPAPLHKRWEALSSEELRARVATGAISKDSAPVALEIIRRREQAASESVEAARIERAEETLRIARDASASAREANDIAREASRVSRREARYAMYAAIIAATAAIIEAKDEILALLFG